MTLFVFLRQYLTFIGLALRQSIIAKECTRLIDLLTNIRERGEEKTETLPTCDACTSYFLSLCSTCPLKSIHRETQALPPFDFFVKNWWFWNSSWLVVRQSFSKLHLEPIDGNTCITMCKLTAEIWDLNKPYQPKHKGCGFKSCFILDVVSSMGRFRA